jgi:plastocyanin
MRSLTSGLLAAALALSCGDNALDPLPLDVQISASSVSVAPGATVDFVVTAQGGALVGIETDYGDGDTDLLPTGGARTARSTFHHTFLAAGVYTVTATITDALAGQKAASVQVTVQ